MDVASKLQVMYPDMPRIEQQQHVLDSCIGAEDAYAVASILMSAQTMQLNDITREKVRVLLQQAYAVEEGGRASVNQALCEAAIQQLNRQMP